MVGEQAGSLKIAVTAPPDQGRANKALVELLAEKLELKKSQIELLSGATSREKRFLLRGMALDVVAAKLQGILES